jgi:hypothetical protein
MKAFLQKTDMASVRMGCFVLALAFYAFCGSPTPDDPGIVEIAVGALLVMACGFAGVCQAAIFEKSAPAWQSAAQALLFFGLSVPLVAGFAHGHSAVSILRDIIPFLFMLLPLFLMPLLVRRPNFFRYALAATVFLGVVFALRSLGGAFGIGSVAAYSYFENMPTVLFASLFLMGAGAVYFLRRFTLKSFLVFVLALMLASPGLLAMAITAQRASLGYFVFYVLVLFGLSLYRRPYRSIFLLIPATALMILFLGAFQNLAEVLMEKSTLVGFNMRWEEMAAAWREISGNPLGAVFGAGWGASFESPAVAAMRINYTHSLLTSAVLKTGLAGLTLVILYLLGLGRGLAGFISRNPVLALALAGPLLIDVLLYASFKSLDFGLILLLIPAAATYENVASRA